MSRYTGIYLSNIENVYKLGNYTEHSFRPALKEWLENLQNISALNEPRRIQCGAPDLLIHSKGENPLIIGYIETKAPNIKLSSIENEDQIKRYITAIDNIILTNYLDFRWYVNGQLLLSAEIATIRSGIFEINKERITIIEQIIESFVNHRLAPINNAKELAEKMARITALIRDTILAAFKSRLTSDILKDLRKVLSEVLIPHQTEAEFADMFSQTIAYGLFAARLNHDDTTGDFRRYNAQVTIPQNYPFLRRLFATIGGPCMEEEVYGSYVNDLVQLLSVIDKKAIISGFSNNNYEEDPIFHFYETFLTAYNPRLRDQRGVYYTPKPVVEYIVSSVDFLLKTNFNLPEGLSHSEKIPYYSKLDGKDKYDKKEPQLMILDPACGTGTFLYSVINYIRASFITKGNAGKWQIYVKDLITRIFGFEFLMAPYTIAHLKLLMQLSAVDLPEELREDWAYGIDRDECLGIFLTNTLEEGIKKSELLLGSYISDEANSAVKVKRDLPIMVVLGNPPYYASSSNDNEWINCLMQDYYRIDGGPLRERNSKWLRDDYVKFIRFGQLRIEETGCGILAFITNHGFLKNPTFRGMRQQLLNTFTDIYVLDLHGNSNYRESAPNGTQDENVFDIQAGVSINIFIKKPNYTGEGNIYHSEIWGLRDSKYSWLRNHNIDTTLWEKLKPKSPYYLFKPIDLDIHKEYQCGWKLTDIFMINGVGITTARDHVVINFDKQPLLDCAILFINKKDSNSEVCYKLRIPEKKGWNIVRARKQLRSENNIEKYLKPISYRPFDNRTIFFHDSLVWRTAKRVMKHMLYDGNIALISARSNKSQEPDHFFCTRFLMEAKCGESTTQSSLFPLYVINQSEMEERTFKTHNINQKFVQSIEELYRLKFIEDGSGDLLTTFGPEDILNYIYAIVYCPSYRERYSAFFKIDFPYIPITHKIELFRTLANKGAKLISLHLIEGDIKDVLDIIFPIPGSNAVESGFPKYLPPGEIDPITNEPLTRGRIYISKARKRKNIKAQYFEGVPPKVWAFRIGGYQICKKWLKQREGHILNIQDLNYFEKVLTIISETLRIMEEIDSIIIDWPL